MIIGKRLLLQHIIIIIIVVIRKRRTTIGVGQKKVVDACVESSQAPKETKTVLRRDRALLIQVELNDTSDQHLQFW